MNDTEMEYIIFCREKRQKELKDRQAGIDACNALTLEQLQELSTVYIGGLSGFLNMTNNSYEWKISFKIRAEERG